MEMNSSPALFHPPSPPKSRGGLCRLLRKIRLELGFQIQTLTRMSNIIPPSEDSSGAQNLHPERKEEFSRLQNNNMTFTPRIEDSTIGDV